MHLTRYTDYSLRVLLYLGTHEERVCSISEIAKAYGISQNHLMKVVHNLGKAGYVKSVRGRLGGVRLAKACEEINIGAVVRLMEEDLQLVDCGSCLIEMCIRDRRGPWHCAGIRQGGRRRGGE